VIKLGVLGSTNGTDLQAVIDAILSERLNACVSVVVSNRAGAFILERANNHGVPAFFISHEEKSREVFDKEITIILKEHRVDLVLLIGFMRILSSGFCREWHDKILNVHPSLLPKYAGGMNNSVHKDVLENKDVETGCTIHLVTEELDAGPIIVQKRCAVDKRETIASLKAKVQALEGIALIEAIQLVGGNEKT
tara:strand:- start:974 stop:1555 length:582 start_codon:yes stop_codon:yes gene_type:complete